MSWYIFSNAFIRLIPFLPWVCLSIFFFSFIFVFFYLLFWPSLLLSLFLTYPLSFSQCTSSSHFSFYHFSPHWLPSLFPFVHFFATVSYKEQVTNKTDSLAPPAICRPQYKAGIKILAVSWSLVPPKKQGWNYELNW